MNAIFESRLIVGLRRLLCVLLAFQLFACATIHPERPTVLSPFGDGTQWIVVEDLVFDVTLNDGGTKTIRVPKGFVTDLASTPRIVWSVYPPFGNYLTASILHDYLYWRQSCTKDQADKILYQTMRDGGASQTTQTLFIDALGAAGGAAWRSNAEEVSQHLIRVIPPQYIPTDANILWDPYRRSMQQQGVRELPVASDANLPEVCAALGNEIKPVTNVIAALRSK